MFFWLCIQLYVICMQKSYLTYSLERQDISGWLMTQKFYSVHSQSLVKFCLLINAFVFYVCYPILMNKLIRLKSLLRYFYKVNVWAQLSRSRINAERKLKFLCVFNIIPGRPSIQRK